eukprot:Skav202352  [mRNA]  locus=scaffold2638:310766:317503:- [translate_table: standard]
MHQILSQYFSLLVQVAFDDQVRIGMAQMLESVPAEIQGDLPTKQAQIDWDAFHFENRRALELPLSPQKALYAVDDLHRIEAMQEQRVSVNARTFGKLIRCAAEARRPEEAVRFLQQSQQHGPWMSRASLPVMQSRLWLLQLDMREWVKHWTPSGVLKSSWQQAHRSTDQHGCKRHVIGRVSPKEETWGLLASAWARQGESEKAAQWLRQVGQAECSHWFFQLGIVESSLLVGS